MYLTVCCIQIILPITLELTNQRISRNNEQFGESPELIARLVSRNRAAFATDLQISCITRTMAYYDNLEEWYHPSFIYFAASYSFMVCMQQKC